MAWALQLDGIDDRLEVAGTGLSSGDVLTIEYTDFAVRENDWNYFIDANSYRPWFAINNYGRFQFNTNAMTATIDGSPITSNSTVAPSDGLDHTLEITMTQGTNLEYFFCSKWLDGNSQLKLKSITISTKHNYDATASNHTTGQPVLTDTIGGNNAQGVNFPTDGSAWVDLGGDPVLEVDVSSIVNSSTVFAPESVQAGIPDLQMPLVSSTVGVHNPEVLSGSLVQAETVEGSSDVPNPEVLYGKVLQAESVQGEAVVYGVSISQPLSVGLEKVNSDSVVFDLYVLSGNGIQVPLDRKQTMNEVCGFLREMGFKGSNNDVLMQWMFTEGIEDGGLNDRFNQYLKSQGLDGTLTDMKAEWKKI